MRRSSLAAGVVLAFVLAGLAAAQNGDKAPSYNPTAEIQVQGDVVAVRTHAGWMGWDGLYLTVRSRDATYEVHLAPASFLDLLELKIAAEDKIELKGCLTKVDGASVLLVREIRKANVVVNVRDPKGRPIW